MLARLRRIFQRRVGVSNRVYSNVHRNICEECKKIKGTKNETCKDSPVTSFCFTNIRFWGSKNISGRMGESNLKEKVKCPSERTCMEAHNFEYRMAMKDTDRCVIDKAACEAVQGTDSILQKLCPYGNEDKSKLVGHNILGIR